MHSKPMAILRPNASASSPKRPIFLRDQGRETLLRRHCAQPIMALKLDRERTSKISIKFFIFFVTSYRHPCLRRGPRQGSYQQPARSQVGDCEIPNAHHI